MIRALRRATGGGQSLATTRFSARSCNVCTLKGALESDVRSALRHLFLVSVLLQRTPTSTPSWPVTTHHQPYLRCSGPSRRIPAPTIWGDSRSHWASTAPHSPCHAHQSARDLENRDAFTNRRLDRRTRPRTRGHRRCRVHRCAAHAGSRLRPHGRRGSCPGPGHHRDPGSKLHNHQNSGPNRHGHPNPGPNRHEDPNPGPNGPGHPNPGPNGRDDPNPGPNRHGLARLTGRIWDGAHGLRMAWTQHQSNGTSTSGQPDDAVAIKIVAAATGA